MEFEIGFDGNKFVGEFINILDIKILVVFVEFFCLIGISSSSSSSSVMW